MTKPTGNEFIFSPRYRLARHLLFWVVWYIAWSTFWTAVWATYEQRQATFGGSTLRRILLWMPVFIVYTYPVSHFAIKRLMIKNKLGLFIAFLLFWCFVGWYANIYYRVYFFYPMLNKWKIVHTVYLPEAQTLLCMATTVATMSAAILLKHWTETQQRWARAEKEKISAQLELLKAQLHPHFLFNTLNNIYSFAMHTSPETPGLILKLSSLLSYVLYDCKAEEVLLSNELEVMKNYIGLEKERYGDKLDVSLNFEGDIEGKAIAPLLILPFLENAFKHGTSEQLESPWMSVDIVVKGQNFKCKVVNSKNEIVPYRENGVGISNVRKRLELLYPGRYELKLSDERDFFVVSMNLILNTTEVSKILPQQKPELQKTVYENSLLADR